MKTTTKADPAEDLIFRKLKSGKIATNARLGDVAGVVEYMDGEQDFDRITRETNPALYDWFCEIELAYHDAMQLRDMVEGGGVQPEMTRDDYEQIDDEIETATANWDALFSKPLIEIYADMGAHGLENAPTDSGDAPCKRANKAADGAANAEVLAMLKEIGGKVDAARDTIREDIANTGDDLFAAMGEKQKPPTPNELDDSTENEINAKLSAVLKSTTGRKREERDKAIERFLDQSQIRFKGHTLREIFKDVDAVERFLNKMRMRKVDRRKRK